ncbi:VWA protein [Teladorsagia circumcincta]|uniref:VWA protein n=1 Tax=Teladorsagia circumcincta TaxID=45464 RepID=A0A2G9UVB3_TELCI|nr:VWA protein [Teladorsagia circumcincta]
MFSFQLYDQFVEPEQFDPRDELKRSKAAVESYLRRRADFAYKAKVSLEVREIVNASDEEVNDPKSKDFIRFMSAKQGNDATTIYVHDHSLRRTKVNETRNFTLAANANFYSLSTSSIASAVHIPTPLYDRTASWFWDNHIEHLDLFDCRNTQWYINAATNSKNVIIMLDMSGSMLGQRYEIAKQTTEAILETLSHNDYFNIMPLLRNKMNNVSSEGKAEYEKALPHAFTTLLNLPGHYELHTREEMALMEPNATEERIHVVFPEHVLSADPEYIEAADLFQISSHHGRPDQGCENVIMLITDGAPNVYKEIFDLYNKDKKNGAIRDQVVGAIFLASGVAGLLDTDELSVVQGC